MKDVMCLYCHGFGFYIPSHIDVDDIDEERDATCQICDGTGFNIVEEE